MPKIEYTKEGFYNAILCQQRATNITELSTFLARQGQNRLRIHANINVPYDKFAADASMVIGKLNERDFYLDPRGFILEVDDNSLDGENESAVGRFDPPALIKYLPGFRMVLTEPIPFQSVKGFGQYQGDAPALPKKIQVYVGNSMRAYATIEKHDAAYHVLPSVGERKVCPAIEDVVRNVIQISKLHQREADFFAAREVVIREELPNLLKQQ